MPNPEIIFIDKKTFSEKMNRRVFGKQLPEVSLFFRKENIVAVKIPSFAKREKKIELVENTIVLDGNSVAFIGNAKEEEIYKIIESNLELASVPEKFIISVIEDYSEIVLDLLAEIEAEFNVLEDYILKSKTKHTMEKIFALKKNLMKVRRASKHYLRIYSIVARSNKEVYSESIQVYEKLMHLEELTDTYKELLSNMIDAHLTVISNKMNQVMKVLTVIMTTAIPLTVISGIYGMNIALPMQEKENAFFLVMGLMAVVVVLMLAFFIKLGWLKED